MWVERWVLDRGEVGEEPWGVVGLEEAGETGWEL